MSTPILHQSSWEINPPLPDPDREPEVARSFQIALVSAVHRADTTAILDSMAAMADEHDAAELRRAADELEQTARRSLAVKLRRAEVDACIEHDNLAMWRTTWFALSGEERSPWTKTAWHNYSQAVLRYNEARAMARAIAGILAERTR